MLTISNWFKCKFGDVSFVFDDAEVDKKVGLIGNSTPTFCGL